MQAFLHLKQTLALSLQHTIHWNTRPLSYNLRDVFFPYHLIQVLLLFPCFFLCSEILFQLQPLALILRSLLIIPLLPGVLLICDELLYLQLRFLEIGRKTIDSNTQFGRRFIHQVYSLIG